MQKFKEFWSLIVAVVSGAAVVVGGLCLFVECNRIGWFPEDMTLGEGVALYGLFVGLTIVCALYWAGITSVGLLIARWPMEWVARYMRNVHPSAPAYVPANFKIMWSFPVWVCAIIALIVGVLLLRSEPIKAVTYAAIALMQGAFAGFLLITLARRRFDRTGIAVPRVEATAPAHRATNLRQAAYAFLGIWLLGPFLFGKNQGSLIESAFKLAQLRKDHATVHVATPWDTRLTALGLKSKESFLGLTHARFDDLTVRIRGVGSRVVLEVPAKTRGSIFVNIPRQFVEIE